MRAPIQSRHAHLASSPTGLSSKRFWAAAAPQCSYHGPRDLRQNRPDLLQNLTTHSLSDCCDPLLAKATGALANAPAKPVIRIRLASEPEPLDAKRRYGLYCFSRTGLFERPERKRKRRPAQVGRLVEILRPRLKRGGEDCDARSEPLSKPRKSWGFADRADRLPANGGRALAAYFRTADGASQRIMVYWSLARAELGREPGMADFRPVLRHLRGGENTTCQAKC